MITLSYPTTSARLRRAEIFRTCIALFSGMFLTGADFFSPGRFDARRSPSKPSRLQRSGKLPMAISRWARNAAGAADAS